jgi:hypothetical protein
MKSFFALLAVALLFGAGCLNPSTRLSPDMEAPKGSTSDQTFKNDTFHYQFVAPSGSQVSVPQNFTAGGGVSQQRTSVYFGTDANIMIDVHLNGSSQVYSKEKVAADPSFKKIDLNGLDAWQSVASEGFSTTVFFGDSYIYEVQFNSPNEASQDADKLDAFLKSFAITK